MSRGPASPDDAWQHVFEILPITAVLQLASVNRQCWRLSLHEATRRCGGHGHPVIDAGDFCMATLPCHHHVTVEAHRGESSFESDPHLVDAKDEHDKVSEVHVLRFSKGDTASIRDALLKGAQLRPCRDAQADAGYPCVLPSGAYIFVHPEQYPDVQRALCGFELRPFNVVISKPFEYLLDEVLAGFSYRNRPREKRTFRQLLRYR
mmetsp:Transcript_23483/g.59790  ORF Transcript_23483/g.59790 Transcript_23483/m.59790 type:complete len:206 (+) Transcript_23483:13-630(+)